jgi:predicted Zn-dependent peptidase
MLKAPSFQKSEIDRIKKNLHNWLNLEKDNARGHAHDALQNVLFGEADRRRTASIPTLQNALTHTTPKTIATLHERTMREPWTVTISGTPAHIASVKKLLGTLKRGRVPNSQTPVHVPKDVTKRLVLTHNIPSKHNIEFSFGGPLPLTLHHPDYLPFVFGLAVLGKWGGFAGRLMSTVREKEGLTYSIYSRTESVFGNEAGYWRIMTFFSPEKAVTGVSSTLRELTKIAKQGVSDKEMERFKTILNTQQTLLNDSLLSSLTDLHSFLSEGFTLDQMAEYKARLLAVTKKEVNAALKKYLNPDALVISAVGPVAKVKKELETFTN